MLVVENTTTPTPMTVSDETSVCLQEIDARSTEEARVELSPRDAERLDNDEAEMNCCEPTDNLKQDVQNCLRSITGANKRDGI